MNRPLLLPMWRFGAVTNYFIHNHIHKQTCCKLARVTTSTTSKLNFEPQLLSLHQCLWTSTVIQNSSVSKTEARRWKKKKRRLKAVGSILTDPGVPIPQEMQRDKLVKYLVNSAVVQDEIIAINKPPGLSVSSDHSEAVNFLQLLPEVAEAVGHPSAEFAKGPERETSGLLLLGHNKTVAGEIAEAFSAAKRSKQLFRKYWAVTVGIPSPAQGIINEPMGFEKIGDQLLGVVRHDPSRSSFKRKKQPDWKPTKRKAVNKKAETHYNVLSSNKELKCALLELKLHSFCKNQLQVHLTHKLHPVIGDHIYSNRIRSILGMPVLMDPHEALPATQDVGPLLKSALLIRSGLLHLLPLHLHWYEVTLPKWRNKKNVCIRVSPPDYFWKTLEMLDLSPPQLPDS